MCKNESAVILMYHSISADLDRKWIDPDNDIPEEIFETQMRYLAQNCNVVSMGDLCDSIRNKIPIQPRTVVITFDDGYRNNLRNAARVLKKYNLPAIIYLATGYVGRGDTQWIDELYTCFKYRTCHRLEIDGIGEVNLSIKNEFNLAYGRIKRILVKGDIGDRRQVLNHVCEQLCPSSTPRHLTMNWKDLSESIDLYPDITWGVHTANHMDLTRLNQQAIDHQILRSLADISENVGLETKHFSYPYGRWNPAVRDRVIQAGLISAVTTEPVPAVNCESDLYSLPRTEVPRNMTMFKYLVSGAYPNLSQSLFGRPMDLSAEH